MKKKLLLLITILSISYNANSQERQFASIQEVVDHHILELKENYKNLERIYIEVRLDDHFRSPDQTYMLENVVDPKSLEKNKKYFLVYVIINSQSNRNLVQVSDAWLSRESNKKVKIAFQRNVKMYEIR
jgi:hypothetical protein